MYRQGEASSSSLTRAAEQLVGSPGRKSSENSPHVFTSVSHSSFIRKATSTDFQVSGACPLKTPLEMLASIGAAQDKPPPPSSGIGIEDFFRQPFAPVVTLQDKAARSITRSSRTVLNQKLTDVDFFSENTVGAASLDYDETMDPIHAGIVSSEEATVFFELYVLVLHCYHGVLGYADALLGRFWEHVHPMVCANMPDEVELANIVLG